MNLNAKLSNLQISLIISSVLTILVVSAGGIVPGDCCSGTPSYIDPALIVSFILSITGMLTTLVVWSVFFLMVYICGRSVERDNEIMDNTP
jgi:uncharacterized Tic20 family protein